MTTKNGGPRAAKSEDIYIGNRIRQARIEASMSQSELGKVLDVSFQQIQKYEKGINRVGGSRFELLASTLKKPIAWFFATGDGAANIDPAMSKFVTTKEGIALAARFYKLTPRSRELVIALVNQLGRGA
jgi:transcriptional regulator with XRE-family HTH domain